MKINWHPYRPSLWIPYVIMGFLMVQCLAAQETSFNDVKTSFEKAVLRENQQTQKQESSLNENYAKYLEGRVPQYQQAGQLDKVLWLQQEQASLREGGDLRELSEETDAEMKDLRNKYIEARQKIRDEKTVAQRSLYERYEDYLENQIVHLTRTGQIDDAQLAQDELKRCRSSKPKDPEFEKIIRAADRLFYFEKLISKPLKYSNLIDVTDFNNRTWRNIEPILIGKVTVKEMKYFNFENGSVTYPKFGTELSAGIIHTGELSLVIEFEAAEANMKSVGSIFSLSNAEGTVDFALGQEGDRLRLFLKTSENENEFIDLGEIRPNEKSRVLIEYKSNSLLAYRDEKVLKTPGLKGDFGNWDLTEMVLGNVANGDQPWPGLIRGFILENHINERRNISNRARMLGDYE